MDRKRPPPQPNRSILFASRTASAINARAHLWASSFRHFADDFSSAYVCVDCWTVYGGTRCWRSIKAPTDKQAYKTNILLIDTPRSLFTFERFIWFFCTVSLSNPAASFPIYLLGWTEFVSIEIKYWSTGYWRFSIDLDSMLDVYGHTIIFTLLFPSKIVLINLEQLVNTAVYVCVRSLWPPPNICLIWCMHMRETLFKLMPNPYRIRILFRC